MNRDVWGIPRVVSQFGKVVIALLLVWFSLAWISCPAGVGWAATPLAKRSPLEQTITLGNEAGELRFTPNTLMFQAGKRYQLHLVNPSNHKHYFTAKDFADAIWSQKVDAGNVEIKGAIHELELRAHTQADWVFVPVRAGSYSLRCTVPGHTEAGMVGTLQITG